MVRVVALCLLVLDFAIIADISWHAAARIRELAPSPRNPQLLIAVEDWEYSTYLAALFGLAAVGWSACWQQLGAGWFSRWGRPVARLGTIGAVFGGFVLGCGFALWQSVDDGIFERRAWEMLWLLGASLGGVFGTAIGCGLGMVAAASQRPESDNAA